MTTQTTVPTFRETFNRSRINKDAKPMLAADAIKAAGLNWELETHPIFYKNDNGSYRKIENRWTNAVVRKDNGDCLGVVGSRYFPIPNKDLFGFFDEVVKTKEAVYCGGGQFLDGRMVWLQARLPKNTLIARQDVIERDITLITSHDGTFPMMISLCGMRIACLNQLPLIRQAKELTVRHTANFKSKVSEARRILGLSLNFFEEFETQANQMAKVKLDVKGATRYFNEVLEIDPAKEKKEEVPSQRLAQRDQLVKLFDQGQGQQQSNIRHTLWAAYNAVTEFSDHFADVRSAEEDATNRLRHSWIGTGNRLKMDAFEDALELVPVLAKK